MCSAWNNWDLTQTGFCEPQGSVCAAVVQNTERGTVFSAMTAVCDGGCPGGSVCTVQSNYCTDNPASYICLPDAFTAIGALQSVSVCV
jgi:hypothetical protein